MLRNASSAREPTILLAEDDAGDVALLQRAFDRATGRKVQIVTNGEEAIDYLAGNGRYADRQTYPLPIVVLLDLKMPRKSGLEVLGWIRSQPCIRRLPIIGITASQNTEDLNRAYDLGINSFLKKPLGFPELAAVIDAFVEYWFVFSRNPSLAPAEPVRDHKPSEPRPDE